MLRYKKFHRTLTKTFTILTNEISLILTTCFQVTNNEKCFTIAFLKHQQKGKGQKEVDVDLDIYALNLVPEVSTLPNLVAINVI